MIPFRFRCLGKGKNSLNVFYRLICSRFSFNAVIPSVIFFKAKYVFNFVSMWFKFGFVMSVIVIPCFFEISPLFAAEINTELVNCNMVEHKVLFESWRNSMQIAPVSEFQPNENRSECLSQFYACELLGFPILKSDSYRIGSKDSDSASDESNGSSEERSVSTRQFLFSLFVGVSVGTITVIIGNLIIIFIYTQRWK